MDHRQGGNSYTYHYCNHCNCQCAGGTFCLEHPIICIKLGKNDFLHGRNWYCPCHSKYTTKPGEALKEISKGVGFINDTLHPVKPEPTTEVITAAEERADVDERKPDVPLLMTIEAENEKDNLVIPADTFLAASSADNYIKVFYRVDDLLKTCILRTTLKKLEENVLPYPAIVRCHRTAIVNIAAVQNLTGSAQGYRLQLACLPDEIPVSRNLNQLIKDKLAAIHP